MEQLKKVNPKSLNIKNSVGTPLWFNSSSADLYVEVMGHKIIHFEISYGTNIILGGIKDNLTIGEIISNDNAETPDLINRSSLVAPSSHSREKIIPLALQIIQATPELPSDIAEGITRFLQSDGQDNSSLTMQRPYRSI
ncbi:MAG: hypothetical protein A2504_15735 [Bdellovibrionales bacterium RIFOXYD12_FULL_39_22]|nr:MAG: hypothetical protein A2385_03165 [Bdellovibrionales bacterium RIFOXYB1_FULL_39_21]OFZ43244.1 MAG: hypothetical protein A2485_12310 [Bdellovibrionales bacterium RIFOXYC12_FULL_39_17]OFZ47982.1 MAG: hypothetical protein A2404_16950 [Bdellovibrionales bacterium RIFOXYC1_FULL_39_130]OFZ75762.1 MAG: hypothetical protein A2560_13450 [Bdellovibrionales bacterium RIFOXYD1_FULL_39_84]OFZ94252.1 MAG: hypothetical protein A2504_15735 [Bdellovibrionales bacterium RIFOXYD12_FULL_39_22]HLE11677.1 hy